MSSVLILPGLLIILTLSACTRPPVSVDLGEHDSSFGPGLAEQRGIQQEVRTQRSREEQRILEQERLLRELENPSVRAAYEAYNSAVADASRAREAYAKAQRKLLSAENERRWEFDTVIASRRDAEVGTLLFTSQVAEFQYEQRRNKFYARYRSELDTEMARRAEFDDSVSRSTKQEHEALLGLETKVKLAKDIFDDIRLTTFGVRFDSGRSPDERIISVFFATDRVVSGDPQEVASYTDSREVDPKLKFGICEVHIPSTHRMGSVESPFATGVQSLDRFIASRPTRDKHVVLFRVEPLSESGFFPALTARMASVEPEAFVFVHGYNVSFGEACRRTGQIAYDIGFRGAPILYSWSSRGSVLDYFKDAESSRASSANLERFLEAVSVRTRATRLNIIAHSMGTRALVNALQSLALRQPSGGRRMFSQLVLAAPDIDAAEFRNAAVRISTIADRTTLYASAQDEALMVAKKIAGFQRAGEAGASLLILPGLDTVDATGVRESVLGHSDYGSNRALITDLRELIHFGRQPDDRSGIRARMQERRKYWEFPP